MTRIVFVVRFRDELLMKSTKFGSENVFVPI